MEEEVVFNNVVVVATKMKTVKFLHPKRFFLLLKTKEKIPTYIGSFHK
jgi:hypothetical protein